jgi:hypothetical protein
MFARQPLTDGRAVLRPRRLDRVLLAIRPILERPMVEAAEAWHPHGNNPSSLVHHSTIFVMHSIRFAKAYYFAAFFLGAAMAVLIAIPARASDGVQPDQVENAPALAVR